MRRKSTYCEYNRDLPLKNAAEEFIGFCIFSQLSCGRPWPDRPEQVLDVTERLDEIEAGPDEDSPWLDYAYDPDTDKFTKAPEGSEP